MVLDNLRQRAIDRSPLCVGIDLRRNHLPKEIAEAGLSLEEAYVAYGKEVIDASREYASSYKLQIACYEAEGFEGLRAYSRIMQYARLKGELVIADIKRGDIGSTAAMYAAGHLKGDFEADILTLNGYMGYDAINPYFEYFANNKGAFVLAKTSNPGSKDFQDLKVDGEPLYAKVLDKIYQWGLEVKGDAEFAPLGAVVGVNELKELDLIKERAKNIFLLIPGYGAQGAKIEDIAHVIRERKNGVVNVSRGYTAGLSDDVDFRKQLVERAQNLAKELRECIR